tara:strand:- start:231 stop:578 length:348 start_codon:yes stop_codon:yes gene_type:complete
MTEEQLDAWIAALEDPETKKGSGALKTRDGKMCCLGVLAQLNGVTQKTGSENQVIFDFGEEAPRLRDGRTFSRLTIPEGWMGVPDPGKLAAINDNSDTFVPVVEWIKMHHSQYID